MTRFGHKLNYVINTFVKHTPVFSFTGRINDIDVQTLHLNALNFAGVVGWTAFSAGRPTYFVMRRAMPYCACNIYRMGRFHPL